jgi:hypothetical protein
LPMGNSRGRIILGHRSPLANPGVFFAVA